MFHVFFGEPPLSHFKIKKFLLRTMNNQGYPNLHEMLKQNQLILVEYQMSPKATQIYDYF
jgi:hypothetical protein